ncbi:uncharacterized protein LY89DRAFT_736531 [Mollisia scopiformis]|uniref:Uncharacterized protein n=1 Tax=Mollisia scopiformis TaxID=149040 RepID=A0A194X2U1_MOLSC|nr:uncharacterized protein LY89DRAFT_736531 [Mollisia scopiformis]KUJ14498.1 hypothetical protein LY89DRAFT_736531 [Mollisia scopiformis]
MKYSLTKTFAFILFIFGTFTLVASIPVDGDQSLDLYDNTTLPSTEALPGGSTEIKSIFAARVMGVFRRDCVGFINRRGYENEARTVSNTLLLTLMLFFGHSISG